MNTARVRRRRLTALLCAGALVLGACGSDDDDDPVAQDETTEGDDGGTTGGTTETTEAASESEPVVGGEVVMAVESETNSYLPGKFAGSEAGYNVARSVYDSLMLRDDEGTLQPYLAESLEPNEDFTEYTLTLREGVTFHDGTPLDAEAIKTVFDTYLKAPGATTAGGLTNVESFEVTGPLTGVYNLIEGNAAFPDVLTLASGMPFSPTAAQSMGDAYIDNPVGTGPFKFVSWTRDDRLIVERYDDYWGEPAHLDGITFQPIPDEDSRFSSVLSGDIDAFITLRQSIVTQAIQAGEDGTMETQLFIGNNGGGAIFNTLTPPVDDARVRLGLAHAIKQEDLVEILGGTGITPVQTQFFSESSPWYSEAVAEVWPTYDAEKAESLLNEYIEDPERSDGKNPGDPIAIEFNCIPDPSTIELSQGYQAFWEAAGVDVTLNTVEFATHVANGVGSADSDPPFAGDYMVNCWRIGGQQDPYTTFEGSFGPVEEKAANVTNYTSPTLDEQIDVLRTSSDTDERKAAVEEIGLELAEQVPLLYTGGTANVIGSRPEVNGIGTWELPSGTKGTGIAEAVTRWDTVWVER